MNKNKDEIKMQKKWVKRKNNKQWNDLKLMNKEWWKYKHKKNRKQIKFDQKIG